MVIPLPTSLNAPARGVLLEWVRRHAPDLRIRHVEGGCVARFTFGGETLDVAALNVPNPTDAIVRRCAWLIYRRLGIFRQLDDHDRTIAEQQIIDAAQRGDTEAAELLGRELALTNEACVAREPVRTKFTPYGGSMFGGKA